MSSVIMDGKDGLIEAIEIFSDLKQLPASITGHVIHAWIYFVSPDGTKISDSDYIGSGVVIA